MLKQVFLINTNLKMRKDTIAVHVAHGEVYYMGLVCEGFYNPEDKWKLNKKHVEWMEDGLMKKVVLKSTEKEMSEFAWILKGLDIWAHPVYDKGVNQVNPGSFTCLVIEPLPENQCQALFGNLKLL